jgi:hypothetical protein
MLAIPRYITSSKIIDGLNIENSSSPTPFCGDFLTLGHIQTTSFIINSSSIYVNQFLVRLHMVPSTYKFFFRGGGGVPRFGTARNQMQISKFKILKRSHEDLLAFYFLTTVSNTSKDLIE